MANNVIKRVWNQNRIVNIEDLRGMAFQAENEGHTFEITGVNDAGSMTLYGTVSGVFLKPDNTDVAIVGAITDGKAYVTLPSSCYDTPGRFGLTVYLTSDSRTTAIYAAIGTVSRTSSGVVAGSTPADVTDLINAIAAAVATIPSSYTSLMADIAPTYSNSAVYAVGQYAWYNGDLKRCTTAITTAESYNSAHWTSAVLGSDVALLSGNVTLDETNLVSVPIEFTRFTTYSFWSFGSSVNASDGYTYQSMPGYARTTWVSLTEPILVNIDNPLYEWCVWGYNNNASASGTYSPSPEYSAKPVVIRPINGTTYFRFGVRRKDGATLTTSYSDTTSDAYKILTSVKTYKLTSSDLITDNVPINAKAVRDNALIFKGFLASTDLNSVTDPGIYSLITSFPV